jgi:hypothetical protein
MSDYIALELGTEDNLDALRYVDAFHFWYSLDHERPLAAADRSPRGNRGRTPEHTRQIAAEMSDSGLRIEAGRLGLCRFRHRGRRHRARREVNRPLLCVIAGNEGGRFHLDRSADVP